MRPLPTITTSWARGVEMTADAFRVTHAVHREYVGEVRAGSDGLNRAGAGGQHQFVVGNGRGASAVAWLDLHATAHAVNFHGLGPVHHPHVLQVLEEDRIAHGA